MKYLKMLGLAAVAAMAFTAFAASSASATTLEVEGDTKNQSVTITASLDPESGGAVLARTDGTLANTCGESHAHGYTTSPFTNTTYVTGTFTGHTAHDKETGQKPTDGLSFANCTNPVTVEDPGTLYIDHITGTTNGTLYSEGAKVKVQTSLGFSVTCLTNEGTHIGTLTGVKEGHATLHVDAVLGCGFLLPSATWKGTYDITSPTGLGVSA